MTSNISKMDKQELLKLRQDITLSSLDLGSKSSLYTEIEEALKKYEEDTMLVQDSEIKPGELEWTN